MTAATPRTLRTPPIVWRPVHPVLGHQEGVCTQGEFHLAPTQGRHVTAYFRPNLPAGVSLTEVLLMVASRAAWDADAYQVAAHDPRGNGSELGIYADHETARQGLAVALTGSLPIPKPDEMLAAAGFHRDDDLYRRSYRGLEHTLKIGELHIDLRRRERSGSQSLIASLTRAVHRPHMLSYGGGGYGVWPLGRGGLSAQVNGLISLSLAAMPRTRAQAA